MSALDIIMDTVVHHFADGLYARQSVIPNGFSVLTHKHIYDHLSILGSGKVIVTCDGVAETYTAPACILIRKEINHRIDALSDSTWFCIHATSETDPLKVDEVTTMKQD